ncbi:XrtA system polysaccharide chain length determinant [Nitrococcus mobilis]|uniref:Polysaccharide chain length determinant protein n=1 Tax=Nitrococcus mobilis Nb-231 TaxID=314278 RepID=A4BSK6_9GAMM|nr:XrtA system polysaccharide chain length determinant [Nitrococcus mobilis]EAR21276.1 polysaccharide chain length determinant protein [Nitrococcus mobilis Nb-231]
MDQIFAQIMEYIRATWRYRWYSLAAAWIVAVLGWAWVYELPDQFEASARVYVDTQSLLAPLLKDLAVRPQVAQQLDMMTRTLFSRPNLEEVARRADLDLSAKTPAALEKVINGLSADIKLTSAGRSNLYSLSYQSPKPQLAQKVVQAALNMFVESSLGSTRKDLSTSRQFIDQQVSVYRQKLHEMEDRIAKFKREHSGMIPGQNESDYYGQLQQAHEQLQQAKLELEEAVRRRDSYEGRLQGTEPVLLGTPIPDTGMGGSSPTELDSRIATLVQNLDQLRLRYTAQHPDVVATERVLAELKAQRRREPRRRNAPSGSVNGGSVGNEDSYLQQLQFALAEAESEVASLQARVNEYQQRYEKLKAAVDTIPAVQVQYKALTRDYNVVQGNYQKLLESRQKATLSGDIESNTKTVDFRVVDPPHVPSTPAGPNRALLSSGVFLAALGVGVGAAFLFGQLRPMIMSRQTLERVSDRPFLGAISLSETPQMLRARRVGLTAYALASGTLLVAFGSLTTFYLIG